MSDERENKKPGRKTDLVKIEAPIRFGNRFYSRKFD